MIDREKIIKGWECHMEADTLGCADCPYRQGWRTCNFADTLFKDVYALLKEQEAVEPVRDEHDDFCCGRCGKRIAWAIKIFDGYGFDTTHPDHLKPEFKCNFCKHCGQAVKWE